MEIKYYCNNRLCGESQKKTYVLKIKKELVMDDNNMAQMFCPHCKTALSIEKNQ
jgi:hypothetical protein